MRKMLGWASAALVAAACGGTGGQGAAAVQPAQDWHAGPDQVCGKCVVEGSGVIAYTADKQVAVSFVTGGVSFSPWPASANWFIGIGGGGAVVSCSRERGILRAVFDAHNPGAGPFTVTVTDGGGAEPDTVAISVPKPAPDMFGAPLEIPASPVVSGDFRITALDGCETTCGQGQCLCPDDHLTCEPCVAPAPAPVPDEHAGADDVCGQCAVSGSGSVTAPSGIVDSFTIDVTPGTGAGSGGEGVAATGHVTFNEQPHAALRPISATVDTIERCVRENGTLMALVSGTVDGTSGTRFEAEVFDFAGSKADQISYWEGPINTPSMGVGLPGTIQVTGLDACVPPPTCGEGQCFCADSGQCEPCPVANQPLPVTLPQ